MCHTLAALLHWSLIRHGKEAYRHWKEAYIHGKEACRHWRLIFHVSFHVCACVSVCRSMASWPLLMCVCMGVCVCLCVQIYAKIQEGVFDVSNETFGIRVVRVCRLLFSVCRPLFSVCRPLFSVCRPLFSVCSPRSRPVSAQTAAVAVPFVRRQRLVPSFPCLLASFPAGSLGPSCSLAMLMMLSCVMLLGDAGRQSARAGGRRSQKELML
jgi:hypothetical protein